MPSRLSNNDVNVLEKIKDPESAVSPIMIDSSLPPDLNLDYDTYVFAKEAEKKIMDDILALEKQRAAFEYQHLDANPHNPTAEERTFRTSMLAKWLVIVMRLDNLVDRYPKYASARNNRVTALRGMYGDGMLVTLWAEEVTIFGDSAKITTTFPIADGISSFVVPNSCTTGHEAMLSKVAIKVLNDLDTGIGLLSPKFSFGALSPLQADRLAKLHMQRGRLYNVAAEKLAQNGKLAENVKTLSGPELRGPVEMKAKLVALKGIKESSWSSVEFAEHASRDFMMAGRYGDKNGSKLAVATNPNAKICGEIVREAMRKEYDAGMGGDLPSIPIDPKPLVCEKGVERTEDVAPEDLQYLWTPSQLQTTSPATGSQTLISPKASPRQRTNKKQCAEVAALKKIEQTLSHLAAID